MNKGNNTRRKFIKNISLGTAAISMRNMLGASNVQTDKLFAQRPNIIFILADDLGYGGLSCYGQNKVHTPYIDQLAAGGMRFTDCYAGSPICSPSRCALLTGKNMGHARFRGNHALVGGMDESDRITLLNEDITIAQLLKQTGYATGMAGKWGMATSGDDPGTPGRKGFDEWLGYISQGHAENFWPWFLWENDRKIYMKTGTFAPDLCTDFIKRQKNNPFFLYYPALYMKGRPWAGTPSFDPFPDKNWSTDEKEWALKIERLDQDVGRIVDTVNNLGMAENTLIIFSSDNGGPPQYNHLIEQNFPLRGFKGDLWEGGIRVPGIANWPGKIQAGTTSSVPWYFPDFFATAAELANINVPPGIDGISMVPTLIGKNQMTTDRFLYWEVHWKKAFRERGFQQAVRWRNWKAVRQEPGRQLELYNLVSDVGEKNNLASQQPEVVSRIEKYLKTARVASPNWPT